MGAFIESSNAVVIIFIMSGLKSCIYVNQSNRNKFGNLSLGELSLDYNAVEFCLFGCLNCWIIIEMKNKL